MNIVIDLKNEIDITDVLFNNTILDMEHKKENFSPSEYLFYVKNSSYDGDLNNKLSLIIIDKNDGYVVNNNFKFNSIEIKEKQLIFIQLLIIKE